MVDQPMFLLPSRTLGPSPYRGEFSRWPRRCINLWANWWRRGPREATVRSPIQTLGLILSGEQKGILKLTEAGLHSQAGARSCLKPLP